MLRKNYRFLKRSRRWRSAEGKSINSCARGSRENFKFLIKSSRESALHWKIDVQRAIMTSTRERAHTQIAVMENCKIDGKIGF